MKGNAQVGLSIKIDKDYMSDEIQEVDEQDEVQTPFMGKGNRHTASQYSAKSSPLRKDSSQ